MIVLDASAILAVFRAERGWEIVDDVISDAVVSVINVGEVAQRQLRLGTSRADIERLFEELDCQIVPVDQALAIDAAELRHRTRTFGLSQADCICFALAQRLSAVAMTADRAWKDVAKAVEVDVRLIR